MQSGDSSNFILGCERVESDFFWVWATLLGLGILLLCYWIGGGRCYAHNIIHRTVSLDHEKCKAKTFEEVATLEQPTGKAETWMVHINTKAKQMASTVKFTIYLDIIDRCTNSIIRLI